MRDDRVHPVSRQIAKLHVLEEARHVSFAKTYLAEIWPTLDDADREPPSTTAAPELVAEIVSLTLDPAVFEHLGIADGATIARANPHHRANVVAGLAKLTSFLDELGVITDSPPLDRARTRRCRLTDRPSTIVELHGRRVAVRQTGTGPVVLLVHGLAGDLHTWDRVVDDLAEHRTVVAPDLPGPWTIRPAAGDYSLGATASWLRDLLDVLGHDRATVVGHSLGGGIAMQFAYQYPQRCARLVLVASGGLGPDVNIALRAASLPGSELVLSLIAHRHLIAAGTKVAKWAGACGFPGTPGLIQTASSYARLAEPADRRSFVNTVRTVDRPPRPAHQRPRPAPPARRHADPGRVGHR